MLWIFMLVLTRRHEEAEPEGIRGSEPCKVVGLDFRAVVDAFVRVGVCEHWLGEGERMTSMMR